MMRTAALTLFLLSVPLPALAETSAEHGKYVVTIAGCNDCHTPGALLGSPDKTKLFAGSNVGFGDPASGVWVGGNLTPDKETGLGKWTAEQIVTAFTKGMLPDGRQLSPIMPWPAYSQMTPDDAKAVAAYLQSLPAVKNEVGGPYKAGEKPGVPYVSATISSDQFMNLPKPK